MKTVIRLDKNIDCNYLCSAIFNMLHKYQSTNTITSNTLLVVDIRTIEQEIDIIPLLECKNIE